MATITFPIAQRIDERTEPFVLQDAPFVSQYYLGYMSKGLEWATPTLLFVERFGCEERASLPAMENGWVVRAEPAGNDGLTNSFYLKVDDAAWTGEAPCDFERIWKYKQARAYPSLERALEVLNWALDLLPESYYSHTSPTLEKGTASRE